MKAFKKFGMWLKNRKQPQFAGLVVFTAIFAVIGVSLLLRSFAAGERLYLLPGSIEVQPGQDFTVTLRLDTGTSTANVVEANIAFDPAKIQYKSTNATSSAFTVEAAQSVNGGVVNIARGNIQSISGDVEVARITFTAISSTSTTANLSVTGQAADGGTAINLSYGNSAITITAPSTPSPSGASYTIEPTVGSPITGAEFGLRVYVTSETAVQGGEVSVVLPTGLSYQGTLNTTGTAFNPATAVSGTNAQRVNLVYVTQSTNLTGKLLIATLPVVASTTGDKSVTFQNARVVDNNEQNIAPVTANPFTITANAASLPAPQVRRTGAGQNIAASENVTDLRQAFTIANFDSAATYTVTLGGQNIPVSGSGFSIPASLGNGDLPLLVSTSKSGASGNASFTIRLRSPNVDRNACVGLDDLLLVNGGYGAASTRFDLNFDGSVSLVDLLTVTQNWTGACV